MMEKIWRVANTIVFGIALCGPWTPFYGDIRSGFELIGDTLWLLGLYLTHISTSNAPFHLLSLFGIFLVFAGLICICLYAVMNLLVVISIYIHKKLFWITLFGILLALCLLMVWAINGYGGWNRLFLGFWLAMLGLSSSLISEIMPRITSKYRSRLSTN